MLRWGLDKYSKELVSIIDVQRRKKCNCICPLCEAALVAHKGDKTAHHFKHYRTEECIGGAETAVHLKAKEIIASAKCIKLPGLNANISTLEHEASVSILSSRLIKLDLADEVIVEKKEGQIRPDLIVIYKGKKLLIEIAVTHFIDAKKKSIIRSQDISCIEIDLRDLHGSTKNITDDEFIENVIYRLDNKKWIHNTRYRQGKDKAFKLIEEKIRDESEKKKLAEDIFNGRIINFLQKNPDITINEDSITKNKDGSNLVEYAIFIDLYITARIPGTTINFKSKEFDAFKINIILNEDDDSIFSMNIEIEDKTIINDSLEYFIERKLKSICYQEGLCRWLDKLVT